MTKSCARGRRVQELPSSLQFEATRPRLVVGFHSKTAPGTLQPILDGIKTGHDGDVVVSQDFTVFSVMPAQM